MRKVRTSATVRADNRHERVGVMHYMQSAILDRQSDWHRMHYPPASACTSLLDMTCTTRTAVNRKSSQHAVAGESLESDTKALTVSLSSCSSSGRGTSSSKSSSSNSSSKGSSNTRSSRLSSVRTQCQCRKPGQCVLTYILRSINTRCRTSLLSAIALRARLSSWPLAAA